MQIAGTVIKESVDTLRLDVLQCALRLDVLLCTLRLDVLLCALRQSVALVMASVRKCRNAETELF